MKTKSHPAAVTLTYRAIMQSDMFRIDGKPIDLPRALTLLGNACHHKEMDESAWSVIGEFSECPLGDLIIGSYWALTEWHAGQSSPSYAAMCALGQVFKPGGTSGPEPDSAEHDAYAAVCAWCETGATTFGRSVATADQWREMLTEGFVCHREGNAVFI